MSYRITVTEEMSGEVGTTRVQTIDEALELVKDALLEAAKTDEQGLRVEVVYTPWVKVEAPIKLG